jgi:hypothetical protein
MFRSITGAAAALLLMPLAGWAQNPPPAAAAQPAAPSETAAAGQPAPAAERVHVEGFRDAKWGMSEAEVKNVIASEFKIPADKLKPETNSTEKTAVISITVPELIEHAGIARISYIFGYKTKKLIQVNILWGTPVDPQAKPEMVVAAANQLRQLFMEEGYDPATVVANARTTDGGVVIFQGQDADKHTTVLRLMSAAAPAPAEKPAKGAAKEREKEKEKPPAQTALFLSYVMDSAKPDVYRLKKGQF